MKLHYIFLSFIFILLEGFFAGSETGFFSLDLILLKFKSSYNKWADILHKFTKKREKIILVSLLGTNFCVIASTQLMSYSLGDIKFKYFFMMAIFPFIVLFIGEIIPKLIFSRVPFYLSKYSYYPFKFLQIIFYPIIFFFEKFISIVDLLFNINRELNDEVSKDIESSFIRKSIKDIFEKESSILNNIVEFENQKIIYFKKPFAFYQLIHFNEEEFQNCSLINLKDKILNILKTKSVDYIILIKKDFSKIFGYIDIKKIFNFLYSKDEDNNIIKDKFYILEIPIYLFESSNLLNLLEIYNKTNSNLFFSVNQYGSVSGVVNINDIFNLFYGDIFLQRENKIFYTEKVSEKVYICDSNLNIKYLKNLINIEIKEGRYSTLNGFLQYLTGKILSQGDKIEYQNVIFEVISVNKRVPDKIKISLI
ncbi:MAG: CNNM domain-containing protein [Spirochaetes bacterium]|nr:CNNM domain-containing protein [Spirochaetota bacterium]